MMGGEARHPVHTFDSGSILLLVSRVGWTEMDGSGEFPMEFDYVIE